MNILNLTNELYIKKIEPNNEKDWYLINQLEEDPLIWGKKGYLWHLSSSIKNSRYKYLLRNDIYNSPFTIYHIDSPIGFLDISHIYKSKIKSSVDLSYAILKKERKKGYMKSVLTNISNYILLDSNVDEVDLIIYPENIASQRVAEASGFTDFLLSENDYHDEYSYVYRKTKAMIHK